MLITVACVTALALFVAQTVLCFCELATLWKWIPLIVVGISEVACWGIGFFMGTGYTIFILAQVLAFWLGALVLAWAAYGIVETIQKN